MSDQDKVVMGIDGGGTTTRVIVTNLKGKVLSWVEEGASSIKKDVHAINNVQHAMNEALRQASSHVSDVQGLVAGIAGIDSDKDYQWAEKLIQMDDLTCPTWIVNDAVIAQRGAFLRKSGIIVISGTGSIIFAINETGESIRNYDFHQYAPSAARFLSYQAVFEILADNTNESDQMLINQILAYWDITCIEELRFLGLKGFIKDRRERDRFFGEMAPLVTEAAIGGSDLARSVCDHAIHQLVVGIEMIGSCFSSPVIPVAYIGSVIDSTYMKRSLTKALQNRTTKSYIVQKPALMPVSGAALMALTKLEIPVNEETIINLKT